MGFDLLGALLIGLAVGLLSTFLGLGGGLVIVPLLPLVAGTSPRETIATSLASVFLVVAFNTWQFHRKALVCWRPALWIGGFAAIGSFLAGRLTAFVPAFALHLGMALVISCLGVLTLRARRRGGIAPARKPLQSRAPGTPDASSGASGRKSFFTTLAGFGTGLISGFTGVGGGLFIAPLLSLFRWVGAREIVPTSNATIVLTSVAGTLAFVGEGGKGAFGLLRPDLSILIFTGALITSRIGQKHHHRLPGRTRDWLIGVLLILLAAKTFHAAWLAY